MIEGHFVQARRLFEMQLEPDQSTDAKALPVYRNWEMLNLARNSEPLTAESLLEWHRLLMEHDPRAKPGEYRSTQNWIGGDGWGPRRAVYVPPPPELVVGLIDDLIAYANSSVEHPLITAAVVHAQFESIHPFVDGNGRVGRALIHWALRDLEPSVPPLALVWYAHGDRYYRMLDTWRSDPDPELFVSYLLESLEAACLSASHLLSGLQSLREQWVETAGGRAGSLKRRMLADLATNPIIDARLAAERLDADASRFSRVARELAQSGVLTETKVLRRRPGRPRTVYEAREVFEIINRFVEEFRAGGIPGVE